MTDRQTRRALYSGRDSERNRTGISAQAADVSGIPLCSKKPYSRFIPCFLHSSLSSSLHMLT